MALTTWLRWLKGGRGLAGCIRYQSPSTVRAPRQRFVPRLDVLEDRTLPSTFTVMNLHESGPGSLRAAIAAANANPGPDQIKFADGVTGTIPLTSGQLDISGDLAIHGPGADELTVSGNNASRVFAIASGVTVTLSDLTIAQGKAVTGVVSTTPACSPSATAPSPATRPWAVPAEAASSTRPARS